MKKQEIEVVSSMFTVFEHSAMIYLLFNALPVARQQYFQFKQYGLLDKHVFRGMITSVGGDSLTPTTIIIEGVVYNVIAPTDAQGVFLTIADKNNDKIFYRMPYFSLVNSVSNIFENRIYKFEPSSGNSFVEFAFVPGASGTSFCMPINFIWDK